MKGFKSLSGFVLVIMLALPASGLAGDTYIVRIYFGLSIPEGNAVSLADWQTYEKSVLANMFPGYNVVDAIGVWNGGQEYSKVVTVMMEKQDTGKADEAARLYAEKFGQDSVMVVHNKVEGCWFVGVKSIVQCIPDVDLR
jgi:hypothetical protein